MPFYNFECKYCKEVTERLVSMATTETKCECGRVSKKVFSGNRAAFVVNGNGAYDSGKFKAK